MAQAERRLRPEIQALRALAVVLVLLYHAFPRRLEGGYVGVDVFFVISGFLITGQLWREARREDRISLGAFWARRARRILPAALLVLLACALVTVVAVPESYWRSFLHEIRAATLYYENWHLADAAVDYNALDNADSPVQHFWSLSIEEQFYLGWPLLILAVTAVARRGVAVALGTVTALSFAYSVYATGQNADTAYFSTFTRVWEFGVGGMLAVLAVELRRPAAAAALSWAGLAAIALAAKGFSDATAFPGAAALLPVAGAAAVIVAGSPAIRWAPSRLLRLPPVQAVGDASYSIYLWHWPLLVLVPIVGERALRAPDKLVVLAVAIGVGALSKRFVEDPFRRSPVLVRRPKRRTYVAAAFATVPVLLVCAAGTSAFDRHLRDNQRQVERIFSDPPPCFGAAALDAAGAPCDAGLADPVIPDPVARGVFPHEGAGGIEPRCVRRERLELCENGRHRGDPSRTIALIGDSHAGHWAAALWAAAREHGWRVVSIVQTRCALAAGRPNVPAHRVDECLRWRRSVYAWLGRHPDVRSVVLGQYRRFYAAVPPGTDLIEATADAYAAAWRRLPPSVERIAVLRDTPETLPYGQTLACVEESMNRGDDPSRDCAMPLSRAFAAPDAAAAAAERVRSKRLRLVDMTRYICEPRACSPVVGHALVYQDENHLTPVFSLTLGPYLGRALVRQGF